MGKIRDLVKKIRDTKRNISCKDRHINDRYDKDLTKSK